MRSWSTCSLFVPLVLAGAPLADARAQSLLTRVGSETSGTLGDAVGRVYQLAASPDDRFVFATAWEQNSIASLRRSEASGTLTVRDVAKNGIDGVDGMQIPGDPGLDRRARHLYVPGKGDDALAVFSIGPDGTLDFVETQRDGIASVQGLANPNVARVSPDGRHVYAGGSAIAILERDEATGTLDAAGSIGLPPPSAELIAMELAPGGETLYAATDDGIFVFARDPATGQLSLVDTEVGDVGGASDLDVVHSLAVSRDGRNVYAGAELAVFAFARLADGALAFAQQQPNAGERVKLALSHDGQRLWSSSQVCDPACSYQQHAYARDRANGQLGPAELGMFQAKVMEFGDILPTRDGRHVYVSDGWNDAIDVASVDPLHFAEWKRDAVGSTDGLDGARATALSPDGRHVYVAGYLDDAVAVFARNAETGALTFGSLVRDGVAGADDLNGATHVTVSPDGRHVYVSAYIDDAVSVFSRNAATGALTFVEVEKDGVGAVQGLNFVSAAALSPDGKHLYAAATNDDALSVFARNATTGALSFVEEQRTGIGDVVDMDGPADVAVSPHGTVVVTANVNADSVSTFARNPTTGALDFAASIAHPSLDEPVALATSPDGEQLYVVSSASDALTAFELDDDGGMGFIGALFDQVGLVRGLDGAHDVAVTPDGRLVLVAGLGSNSVSAFWRDRLSGAIGYAQTEFDTFVDGLEGAHGVATSPDGKHVFVAGQTDDALVTFAPEPGGAAAIAIACAALAALRRGSKAPTRRPRRGSDDARSRAVAARRAAASAPRARPSPRRA